MSKNAITIDQLKIACRHVQEMIDAGVTENLAIRTLELFGDVYAKMQVIGNTSPHHVKHVKLWSINAKKLRDALPGAKPRDYFRVEHGTPRRGFARKILALHQTNALTAVSMDELVVNDYRLAVITLEEDQRLNKIARSKLYNTAEERWAAANIAF